MDQDSMTETYTFKITPLLLLELMKSSIKAGTTPAEYLCGLIEKDSQSSDDNKSLPGKKNSKADSSFLR